MIWPFIPKNLTMDKPNVPGPVMAKLLIIALDGLDASLVVRWSFRGLLQSSWGRHYVGFLKNLYTPIIWSCFLTGENVEELGYDLDALRAMRRAEAFPPVLRQAYMIRRKLLSSRRLGLRALLRKLGFFRGLPPANMPPRLRKRAFLEILRERGLRVKAIEVPGYNERWNEHFRTALSRFITAPMSKRLKFLDYCVRECERRVSLAIGELERRRPDVLMLYLPLPDIAHHLFIKGLRASLVLHRIYWMAEGWAMAVREAAGPEYACLVVSDHGFDRRRKTHSDYGFWSLSLEPPFRPEKITDFHRLVMELVGPS